MLELLKICITHILELRFGPMHDNEINWMLDSHRHFSLYLFQIIYKMQKKKYRTMYKKQIKFPKIIRVSLHRKRIEIALNFPGNDENTLGDACSSCVATVGGWDFSTRLQAERVDYGISRLEDSDNGGGGCH
jgi:hypothetical protein